MRPRSLSAVIAASRSPKGSWPEGRGCRSSQRGLAAAGLLPTSRAGKRLAPPSVTRHHEFLTECLCRPRPPVFGLGRCFVLRRCALAPPPSLPVFRLEVTAAPAVPCSAGHACRRWKAPLPHHPRPTIVGSSSLMLVMVSRQPGRALRAAPYSPPAATPGTRPRGGFRLPVTVAHATHGGLRPLCLVRRASRPCRPQGTLRSPALTPAQPPGGELPSAATPWWAPAPPPAFGSSTRTAPISPMGLSGAAAPGFRAGLTGRRRPSMPCPHRRPCWAGPAA